MKKRLKERWGIHNNWQLLIILWVFAITGSASVFVAKPFLNWIGMSRDAFPVVWWSGWVYWSLRILVIFPLYQVLLVFFGWIFGQFAFFWTFEKKMIQRIGLGFLLK